MKNKKLNKDTPTKQELSIYREFADKVTAIEETTMARVEKDFFMKVAEQQYRATCKFLGVRKI